MGGHLRVRPEQIEAAASVQADIGSCLTTLGSGAPLADAGAGMTGLSIETACRFVSDVVDSAATTVHQELTEHADKLLAAAKHYRDTDAALGRRLAKFAQ